MLELKRVSAGSDQVGVATDGALFGCPLQVRIDTGREW